MAYTTKDTKRKSKEAVVAEPEPAYVQGCIVRCGSVRYLVPKKDVSFFMDLAAVRGWKLEKVYIQKVKTAAGKKAGRKKA